MKKQTKQTKSEIYKVIERQCVVCGKKISVTVFKDRSYIGGRFFDMKLKEGEYWECRACFEE